MLKKILSLILCLCMCFGIVISATSCGSSESSSSNTSSGSTAKVPTTLSFLGITSEETDPENVKMVEEALNEIFKARYKTKIDLTLVTEEKYMDLVEERIEIAKQYEVYDAAIAQYNAYIKKQANTSTTTTDKIFGNWISGGVKVTLETLATRLVYVSEQTTVHEDGRVETLYPEAPSPVDIVMIVDEKMYDDFTNMGLLMDKAIDPSLTSYKNLQKYIYPTFFSELKNLKGMVNAIPNNNMLAESTYLVIDEKALNAYNDACKNAEAGLTSKDAFAIEEFKNYDNEKFEKFLKFVDEKDNGEYMVPFKSEPEALGVFKLFSDDVAIGAYLDPLVGYNPAEGESYAKYEIKNLFEIPQYTKHLATMEKYRKVGYFDWTDRVSNGFAVQVIKGDASVAARYDYDGSGYLVKEIQIPFVLREAIFNGMLAPTSYTSDIKRSMEIIEAINTDPAVKNLLQYGIEGYNYMPNEETGSIIPLNGDYVMDNALTGNVYMGYVPYKADSKQLTAWTYVMKTNLAAVSSPFLLFPVDEAYLQKNLKGILVRAGLSEALEAIPETPLTYEEYTNPISASIASTNLNKLKNANNAYLVEQALAQGKVDNTAADAQERAVNFVKTAPASWVEETVAYKYIDAKYKEIATLKEIETLVGEKLSSSVLKEKYDDYVNARNNAQGYLENIESLRIIAKETLFADMSKEEYATRYGSLGALEFEKAIFDYLKANYEKENNLSAEDYEKLVQDFIATNFKFTDRNTNQQYTYTWADFEKIKENAAKFATPLQQAKAQYAELIKSVSGGYMTAEKLDSLNDVELADEIINSIKIEFYNSYNTSAKEFATTLYDTQILAPFSVTKKELDVLKVKDNALYKDYLAKVKKHYKAQLLETYTKDEYAEMKDTDALQAVLDYYIEAYTQANTKLYQAMGLTREQYNEYYDYASKYIDCVDKMTKAFTYTLRTRYTQAEIDAMTPAQAEEVVYNMVFESDYYMNELAKCIGVELSAYNNNKAQAIAYLGDANDLAYNPGHLADVIRYYKDDLAKKDITVEQARAMAPAEIEEIIMEIIREKDFANYRTIDVELVTLCKAYIEGINTYRENGFENVSDYCSKTAGVLSDNYLFDAIVGYLNDALKVQLEKAAETK